MTLPVRTIWHVAGLWITITFVLALLGAVDAGRFANDTLTILAYTALLHFWAWTDPANS